MKLRAHTPPKPAHSFQQTAFAASLALLGGLACGGDGGKIYLVEDFDTVGDAADVSDNGDGAPQDGAIDGRDDGGPEVDVGQDLVTDGETSIDPTDGDGAELDTSPDGGDSGEVANDPDADQDPLDAPDDSAFIEDFRDLRYVSGEPGATSAVVDTTAPGYAEGEYQALLSVGSGTRVLALTEADGRATNFDPGNYEFASLSVSNHKIQSSGNITIRVVGDLVLRQAVIKASGNVTIVVGGAIRLEDGDITADCDLRIDQHSTGPMVIQAGSYVAALAFPAAPDTLPTQMGSLEINTRGSIESSGLVETSSAPEGVRSGDMTIRSYGDLTFQHGGVLSVGTSSVDSGDIAIYSEGNVTFDDHSYAQTLGVLGVVTIRTSRGVRLDNTSFLGGGPGGAVDLVAAGPFLAEHDSYLSSTSGPASPITVSVVAGSILLGTNSFVDASRGPEGTAGGNTILRTTGTVTIEEGAFVDTSGATCAPGGNANIEALGNVVVGNGSCIHSGAATGTETCAALQGGDVLVRTSGSFLLTGERDPACPLGYLAGRGIPRGTAQVFEALTQTITPPDPRLNSTAFVTSVGITEVPASSPILAIDVTWANGQGTEGALLIAPDGTLAGMQPAEAIVGTTLPSGWRYRVELPTRMLDSARIDRIVVDY